MKSEVVDDLVLLRLPRRCLVADSYWREVQDV